MIKIKNEVRIMSSSLVDNSEYEIYVGLPKEYYSSQDTFPVLYVLDATMMFAMVIQTYNLLRSFNEVEPLVIIGIAHVKEFRKNRARDFMPTKLTSEQIKQKYGDGMESLIPASGGASLFLQFFKQDVIPFVETNYRVSDKDRGIFGHSAGGLFAAYVLFSDPDLFQKYLLSSSASWWDDDVVLIIPDKLVRNNQEIDPRTSIHKNCHDRA